MTFKFVLLWTDLLVFILVALLLAFSIWAKRQDSWRRPLRKVFRRKISVVSAVILSTYVLIGLLDSVHYQPALPQENATDQIHYDVEVKSVLDKLLSPLDEQFETSYSAPFAHQLHVQDAVKQADGSIVYQHQRLQYAATHLSNPEAEKRHDILVRSLKGVAWGLLILLLVTILLVLYLSHQKKQNVLATSKQLVAGKMDYPYLTMLLTLGIVILLASVSACLATHYHIFGTDKVGEDVFYQALKSIRTGLVIGTVSTLVMLPFAIILGVMAGYFRGRIDDGIQYLYTTLSSIPGVLLIAAAILMLQVFMSTHPDLFASNAQRADLRLLILCVILGVTSWTSLCRLLRGESFKLREMDYVQAANNLGVSHVTILKKHIVPNVMHIVLITLVLDFSGLVLAEAVLSYVGVGVDPTMFSWGNMINSARLEMAREPVVWWSLCAAFIFMFTLVLFANFFADSVRDAFDPRLQDA